MAETEFLQLRYDSTIFIPNLITQNGDGKNETFEIKNLSFYPDHALMIYDRWGRKLFESSPYRQDWPKEKIASGTYFFVLKTKNGMQKDWVLVME